MPRYSDAHQDVFSVFATDAWKGEGINTYPSLIVPDNPGQEYIRVSVVLSENGLNPYSVRGLLLIDIFTARTSGPKRPIQIADTLDEHINVKLVKNSVGTTQFGSSNLGKPSPDKDNTALAHTLYSAPFSYFGET